MSDLSQESPLWREWAESRHSVQQMREEIDRLRAENARLIADLAAVTEDRDAYRASSEIRGANIEAMHEVLIELSALLAGQATDFRQVARDLRRMARASLDCSP